LEGSIVNLDIAIYVPYDPAGAGYHGDNSTTVPVGEISPRARDLIATTKLALQAGIAACGPFQPYNGIGKAISDVARQHGFAVVPELSGHGIGREYHQHPLILHIENEDPGEMTPGTVFTIEPCLSEGDGRYTVDPDDKWTLYSADGGRAAQEEHTVLVTDTGVEVLTTHIC
jgi:methionyl aminopeptidase